MGAIVLPSDYGNLSESIGKIAESTAKMINPFHDLQMEMRNQIALNPELAQHLSDMESASPGTLERMGLGNVGKTIAKIQPSHGQIIENAVRPVLEQRLKNPQALEQQVTQTATGMNPLAQAQVPGAQATSQELQFKAEQIPALKELMDNDKTGYLKQYIPLALSLGRAPGDIAKEAKDFMGFNKLSGRFDETENTNLHALAEKFVTGKTSADENELWNAANANPTTAVSAHQAYESAAETQRRASMISMYSGKTAAEEARDDNRAERGEAYNTWTKSGMPPGTTPVDFHDAMFGKGQKKLAAAMNGDTSDPKYTAIAQGMKRAGMNINSAPALKAIGGALNSLDKFGREKDPKAQAAMVPDVNAALAEASAQTGQPVVKLTEEGGKIHALDEQGNQVDPMSLQQRISSWLGGGGSATNTPATAQAQTNAPNAPPLTQADFLRAKTDPGYRNFLNSTHGQAMVDHGVATLPQ
jgi:hypothetical protein